MIVEGPFQEMNTHLNCFVCGRYFDSTEQLGIICTPHGKRMLTHWSCRKTWLMLDLPSREQRCAALHERV